MRSHIKAAEYLRITYQYYHPCYAWTLVALIMLRMRLGLQLVLNEALN